MLFYKEKKKKKKELNLKNKYNKFFLDFFIIES